jgi:hypothetical protein
LYLITGKIQGKKLYADIPNSLILMTFITFRDGPSDRTYSSIRASKREEKSKGKSGEKDANEKTPAESFRLAGVRISF